jgi:hypothetical protein
VALVVDGRRPVVSDEQAFLEAELLGDLAAAIASRSSWTEQMSKTDIGSNSVNAPAVPTLSSTRSKPTWTRVEARRRPGGGIAGLHAAQGAIIGLRVAKMQRACVSED